QRSLLPRRRFCVELRFFRTPSDLGRLDVAYVAVRPPRRPLPWYADVCDDRDKGADVRDDVAMRRPLAMLGVVATLGVARAVHADPGGADPSLDASFLDALTKAGITVMSPSGALKD